MILSIVGVFKMILMLIGAFFILRLVGQLMIAKRNIEEERKLKAQNKKFETERNSKLKSFGKTKIVKETEVKGRVQDVDFEEVN